MPSSEKFLVGLLLTLLAVVVSWRLVHPDRRPADEPLKKEERPRQLLIFGAKWCPACRRLKETLADPRVTAELTRYAVTEVDVDRDKPLAVKHRIGPLPTVVLLDDGRELRRFVGLKPAAEFLIWLNGGQLALVRGK